MTASTAWRLAPLVSQATFRTLLDTLARPGTIARLPEPFGSTIPAVLCLPLALSDLGIPITVVGDPDRWAGDVARATGATVTAPAHAWAAAVVAGFEPALIEQFDPGSALEPERGARLAVLVSELGSGPLSLSLSGPGVPGRRHLRLGGVAPEALRTLQSRNASFPAGLDVWFVTEDGRIAALSRTTELEVIEVDPWGM
ncbi:MAG: phosphonate C-P lyase system protein PhnH [Acidimicrobiales bacterium]